MTASALGRIRTPVGLLAVTIALSGVLSAFLINDIVCLTLTPLVLHLARRLRFDPIPHLIALATAANIGSTGTITGNPQNIYIGSHSGIAYLRFAERLLPVAAIGLVLNFLVVAFVYRKSLFSQVPQGTATESGRGGSHFEHDWLKATLTRLLTAEAPTLAAAQERAITLAAVVLFFAGLPLELVALGGSGGPTARADQAGEGVP